MQFKFQIQLLAEFASESQARLWAAKLDRHMMRAPSPAKTFSISDPISLDQGPDPAHDPALLAYVADLLAMGHNLAAEE